MRCQWCGQFVAADTSPSRRVTRGWMDNIHAWRWFSQTLCPECSAVALTQRAWSKPISQSATSSSQVGRSAVVVEEHDG